MAHGLVEFTNGSMTPQQLVAAFAGIPADITFVDADGIVRYYSDYRIFSRTPEALGRDVVECHGEATRPAVARLLAEFRDGWRDEALFLAEKDGRNVSTRYLALRDADGAYLGCLEIAQWVDEIAPA